MKRLLFCSVLLLLTGCVLYPYDYYSYYGYPDTVYPSVPGYSYGYPYYRSSYPYWYGAPGLSLYFSSPGYYGGRYSYHHGGGRYYGGGRYHGGGRHYHGGGHHPGGGGHHHR